MSNSMSIICCIEWTGMVGSPRKSYTFSLPTIIYGNSNLTILQVKVTLKLNYVNTCWLKVKIFTFICTASLYYEVTLKFEINTPRHNGKKSRKRWGNKMTAWQTAIKTIVHSLPCFSGRGGFIIVNADIFYHSKVTHSTSHNF